MILTAHQSMFLPWCGLIAKIASADAFVQFDEVPIERHGFSNRNRIKTANGELWLTVPVNFTGHLVRPLSQIEIIPGNWKRKHLRSIELAYQRAPYFDHYFPCLQTLYAGDYQRLAHFNSVLLNWLLQELGVHVPIYSASDYHFQGHKSGLVLDMCRKMGATRYIFGAMGADYADVEEFERAGVDVSFQNYHQPEYSQLHGHFIPNLSVIDLLFNEGPRSFDIIMEGHAEA